MGLVRLIDRLFAFWNNLGEKLFPTPRQYQGEIIIEEKRVTLKPYKQPIVSFLWSEVLEVFAYKEDFGTVDMLCVGFRYSNEGSYYRVNEHWTGYDRLCEELKQLPGGINEGWWTQVAFPAFVTNRTTIWGEPKPWPES